MQQALNVHSNPEAAVLPWVAVQRNPWSGSGRQRPELLRFIRELKRQGIRPRLFSRRHELDAAVAERDLRGRLLGIVAAGGDGTLLDVVNRHPGVTVGVLPLGTENLFARAVGLPRCGRAAARVLAQGRRRSFDAACCNGRRFLIVGSAGFDAEVIRRAHLSRTGRITRRFYFKPIAQALAGYRFPQFEVRIDDDPEPISGVLAIVANLPAYALGLPILPDARGDDGWLDICVFKRPGAVRLGRDLLSVIGRRHHRMSHVVVRRARRIQIGAYGEPAPLQLDGDAACTTPAEIAIEPAALEVWAP